MKKTFIVVALVGLMAVAFAAAGSAYAQGGPPEVTPPAGQDGTQPGAGWGMYGRQAGSAGQMPGRYGMLAGDEGPLHEAMISAVAEAIGLDPATVEARLEAGETLSAIAVSQGFSVEEFQSIWLAARETTLQQAVAEGTLSQEQADWMLDRMESMGAGGYGPGYGNCMGGTPLLNGTGLQRGQGRGRGGFQAP
jgi:hypothetical protein